MKFSNEDFHLNKFILWTAAELADKTNSSALLVYVDDIELDELLIEIAKDFSLVVLTRNNKVHERMEKEGVKVLFVPNVNLNRMGQIKVSVMISLSSGIIGVKDNIVVVTGKSDEGILDNILFLDLEHEKSVLSASDIPTISDDIPAALFEAVLNLAVEIASEGREGKPVGAIFVIGDHEKVLQLTRQLIRNPFKGYSDNEKSIFDPDLRETIKEFSTIDGAFILDSKGTVISAGTYLSAALTKEDFPQGLGSRHIASAGITSLTESVAIVISESTGTVRIFKHGVIFMEIERGTKE
ncbi:MAG: DNA integrity scanning protein DisA nucleotide-binding domain protein [Nitrospinae bacterium]|nr:DNA integrity scanning protein DisA nucleotide-binding domain protein [Nitrospinota bacterium]